MVEGVLFIGAVIIAATQFVKYVAEAFKKKVNGAVTIAVAVLVGILVALVDKEIGVTDVSIAQGVMIALAAVGVHTTAREVG